MNIYNINNMPLTLVKLFNNHIIEFIDDICSILDNKVDLLSKQNREINDLYNMIDDISSKMNY